MSLGQFTSSALLYCEPSVPPVTNTATVTATVTETFTKVWEYTAWAACPTAEWPATYTIKEICTGDPAVWTKPAIPPNFIKSIVTCGVCEQKTQTITCPVEEAAQTGEVTIYGNGVTATPASVPAKATGPPDSGMGPGPGAGPGPGPAGGPGANPAGSGPGSGAPAPAPAPGAGPGSSPGAGAAPAGAPMPAPNNNGNAGPGSAPNSGSGSSPAPDSGSAPGAAPAPGGGAADGSSPPMVTPQSNAGTDATGSPYVTAGAPSLRGALLLVSGMFALVSGSIVYY